MKPDNVFIVFKLCAFDTNGYPKHGYLSGPSKTM